MRSGLARVIADHVWPCGRWPWTRLYGLAPFGEGLGRGGCGTLLAVEQERRLLDEDSEQPAFEGAFVAECRRVAGGGAVAVFDCDFGLLVAVEDVVCDE